METKMLHKILITDDDVDDIELLTDSLHEANFNGEFKVFNNGRELLQHLEQQARNLYSLILLDLNMPVLNGFETLKLLKNDDRFNKIPVIVITSSSKTEDEKFCQELGCEDYYRKPFSLSGYHTLAEKVVNFLGR
jgi:CheY-like chemotaxis protein